MNMDNHRLPKQIFLWEKTLNCKNWYVEVGKILASINLRTEYITGDVVNLEDYESAS